VNLAKEQAWNNCPQFSQSRTRLWQGLPTLPPAFPRLRGFPCPGTKRLPGRAAGADNLSQLGFHRINPSASVNGRGRFTMGLRRLESPAFGLLCRNSVVPYP